MFIQYILVFYLLFVDDNKNENEEERNDYQIVESLKCFSLCFFSFFFKEEKEKEERKNKNRVLKMCFLKQFFIRTRAKFDERMLLKTFF